MNKNKSRYQKAITRSTVEIKGDYRPRDRPEAPDPIAEYEKVGPLINLYVLHSESGPYLPRLRHMTS
jgi:hypothetical protein